MIEFQLDETSGVATYLQLAQQVHRALRAQKMIFRATWICRAVVQQPGP